MSLAIEVISIGNEVLTGFTVNTNAAFIGQALLDIGLKVTAQRTLPDDRKLLKAGLEHSLANFDLIICTGGLGPTCDDQTRQIIAELFDCELKFEPKIAEHLQSRYANRPVSINDQATIPSKAEYLLNEIGTASALLFNERGKFIIFLPGVPPELEFFMYQKILPLLKEKYSTMGNEFHQQCSFFQLTESQVDPILRELSAEYPQVEFGIYPNLGIINVHIISHFATADQNLTYQLPVKEKLIAALADNFFSDKTSNIEDVICEICSVRNISIGLVQTSPNLNLSARLSSVLKGAIYIADHDAHRDLISAMFAQLSCEMSLILTGVPVMNDPDEIYTTELTVGLQRRGCDLVVKTLNIRGNKQMLVKRAENFALSELFKLAYAL
jgi:nicotinamide-nucleotide amidase